MYYFLFDLCLYCFIFLKKIKKKTSQDMSRYKINIDNYSSQLRKHKTELESQGSNTDYSSLLSDSWVT